MADRFFSMTNDNKTASGQDSSTMFVESFDEFCVGLIDLQKIRSIIAELLENDPHTIETILLTLDNAFREGLIKSSTYDSLTTDVDHATSADEPTEWSAATREQFSDNHAEADNSLLTEDDTGYPDERPPPKNHASPPEAVEIAPGTLLKNRFELMSKLGAGSMADIYEAIDRRKQEAGATDPRLAIKVISKAYSTHPGAVETLQREALNSHGLIHPNIIRVFDFDWDGNRFFMTMERLNGRSLAAMLDEHRLQPLTFDLAGEVIEGVCRGLSYAHERGVIHADIKPGNIFVSPDEPIKILDFGIARVSGEEGDTLVAGAHTPAYASCEVLEGSEPTQQDDIFSLACVAYRMLTGRKAFGSHTALEAERRHITPQRIEALSPSQWQALERSLAYRRADRVIALDTFAAAFDNKISTTQLSEDSVNQPGDFSPPPGLPLRVGLPAIAALLTVIALALFWPKLEPALNSVIQTENTTTPKSAPPPVVERIAVETDLQPPVEPLPEPLVQPSVEVLIEPTIQAEQSQPDPAPDTGPTRLDELVALAGEAMNDGRLIDPDNDNAQLFVTEMIALEPEAPKTQQHRTRLAELMLLEAMISITDQDFDKATHWINETTALGAPEEMTGRIETELQKARDARNVRQSESLGAIFASATPAAILANPDSTLAAMAAGNKPDPTYSGDEPVASPGSLSLAIALPETPAPAIAAQPLDPGPAGELAQIANADILLSELEFTRFVEPTFPRRLSKFRRRSGWVEIRFRVTPNGRTDDIQVLNAAPDDRFNKSAMAAVSKWRFKPVYIDGTATEKYSSIRMRFEPE